MAAIGMTVGAVIGAEPVVLVKDGQPAATIVLAAQPTRAARLGAMELQAHVKAMTGAMLPIIQEPARPQGLGIFIGAGEAVRAADLNNDSFKEQEYLVRVGPEAILLVGRDAQEFAPVVFDPEDPAAWSGLPDFWEERGSLHAVYDFLEGRCGVRWLNHTANGSVIPRQATLAVAPGELRRSPAFRYRDAIGATGNNPLIYDNVICLWQGDGWGNTPSPEFKRWHDLAYADLLQRYANDSEAVRRARANLARIFLLRHKNGGIPNSCNHSMYGYYDRFWEKSTDPAKAALFVERRPQYFAKGYEGKPEQLCYTNPELVQQLAQDARDYLDGKKTGADLGIFWQPRLPNPFPIESMDNSFYCRCPDCQKLIGKAADQPGESFSVGTYSDYFFQFVNAVAREVKKTHPDGRIITLAYGSHAVPPTFPLENNVDVQYCFWTNRILGHEYAADLALFQRWAEEKKQSGRPLGLWLYYTFPMEYANNGKYHCFPGFFAHKIGEQMRLFRDAGVYGMFHCGYGQEVEAYVTFRLMDDPGLDVDRLLEEYFAGLYGAAAEPMRRLYLAMEEVYCDVARRPTAKVSGPALSWGHLGTAEEMAKYGKLLAEAKTLATAEPAKTNVALFEHAIWSYMVAGREKYVARTSAPIPSLTVPRVAAADGDPDRADWPAAAALPGPWYERGSDQPAERKFSGRAVHDGKFLYLELTDPCPVSKLIASAGVFPCDDWELFVGNRRDLPYRHYSFNHAGTMALLSFGEINARMGVTVENPGIKVSNDISDPERWRARIAIPLPEGLPQGARPQDRVYLNILRISNAALSPQGGFGLASWVSHCTVHEVDRLGELILAP